ncbi:MAG: response regulator transcription factor [Elusimicrobia bacterium]|nr:response regulator transcription factor [Elusimicrobiota bacterium]
MKIRVFLVDDDPHLMGLLREALPAKEFDLQGCQEATRALELIEADPPDVLLLDWRLPDISGMEMCRMVRKHKKLSGLPILMLTAVTPVDKKVDALEGGADDYLTKPFEIEELIARIRAVLRRKASGLVPSETVRVGRLELDPARRQVRLNGRSVHLTRIELELLHLLLKNPGRPLSRQFLVDHVQGYQHSLGLSTRTVDVHMVYLRKKLGSWGPQHIQTVRNMGYLFEPPGS